MKDKERERIIYLFFIEKRIQKDIANILNISKYKVSRTVTKDARYKNEKEMRKKANQQKHVEKTKKYISSERKSKQMNSGTDNMIIKNKHIQASIELSKTKRLTNEAYREWNKSAYLYNKDKKRYEFSDSCQ